MAYLVTNPRRMKRRHNGALNMLLASHLKLSGKKNSPENKKKIAAFKKTEAYAVWKAKTLGGDANTARESKSAAVKKMLAAMSKTRSEIVPKRKKIIADAVAARSGKKAKKAPAKKASAKKASAKKAAAPKAAQVVVKTAKTGRKMYFIAGKLVSREKALAAGAKENGRRRRHHAKHNPRHHAKHNPRHRRHHRRNPDGLWGDLKAQVGAEYTLRNAAYYVGAGVAHAFVAPYVAKGLDYVAGKAGMGEGAAQWIQEHIPYSTTGFIALAASTALGYFTKRPEFYALGGAAAVAGLSMDAASAAQKYMTTPSEAEVPTSMGGIVYDGVAAVSLQPGSYGYAGLVEVPGDYGYGAIEASYSDAKMADAAVCGPDFSVAEGQALVEGPAAIASAAPAPTVAQGLRKNDGDCSRFAGQHMHRWGWLIKAVGLKRAQAIAAMKPAARLKTIAALRAQAMAAVDQAASSALPDYGTIVSGDYGSLVYAGAAY